MDPETTHFDDFNQAMDFICDKLDQWENVGEPACGVCLTAKTKKLLEKYEKQLAEKGYDVYRIKRSSPEGSHRHQLRENFGVFGVKRTSGRSGPGRLSG